MIEPRDDSDSNESDYESDLEMDKDSVLSSEEKCIVSDDDDDSDSFSEEETEFSEEKSQSVKPLWDSELSLEDLMHIREKVGTKKFNNKILATVTKSEQSKKPIQARSTKPIPEGKNRPLEMSSKQKVPRIRQVVNVPKAKFQARDPRFDNLCGSEYNEEIFSKSYSFLDDIRTREAETLKKKLKKCKTDEQKKQVKYLLKRMKEQNKSREQRANKRAMEKVWKKEERMKVEKGIKRPYFLKKSDKKKLYMAKRNEQLKLNGVLEKTEAKRDKKKKSKESKVMPYERRMNFKS